MQAVTLIAQPARLEGRANVIVRSNGSAAAARPSDKSKAKKKGVKSDLELLTAFRSGDERAFAELYTRYKAEIYTFCLRMLGGDSAEAGDAFQETFIKVYEKIHSFRYGENVRGWLYMI